MSKKRMLVFFLLIAAVVGTIVLIKEGSPLMVRVSVGPIATTVWQGRCGAHHCSDGWSIKIERPDCAEYLCLAVVEVVGGPVTIRDEGWEVTLRPGGYDLYLTEEVLIYSGR